VQPLSSVTIASDNSDNTTLAKTDDVITLSFTSASAEAIKTPSVSIAGHAVDASSGDNITWSATYKMRDTDSDNDSQKLVSLNIVFYDLAGNVSEWVYDWHLAEFYLFSPKKNPTGPKKGQYKVIRGGNWRNNSEDVKMVYRNATIPSIRNKTLGFRCVQSKGIPPNKYPSPS